MHMAKLTGREAFLLSTEVPDADWPEEEIQAILSPAGPEAPAGWGSDRGPPPLIPGGPGVGEHSRGGSKPHP